jgi:hypothetical protein
MTEDRRTVAACPECDEPTIETRVEGGHNPNVEQYKCWGCGHRFDEPHTRPPKRQRGKNENGLAGDLVDADSDEVSAGE